MRLRPSLIASACLVGGLAAVVACTTDYQQGKGDVAYGDPDSLANKRPPGVTLDVTADGGGATTSSSGGSAIVCVKNGGTLAAMEGGACTVSFAKDIMGSFGTANCNSTSCHGGATPLNLPPIEPSDGPSTWNNLQAYMVNGGLNYINPCSTDPATSALSLNVLATPGAKGGQHMPQGAQLPQADIDKITTWLKCGSPNN